MTSIQASTMVSRGINRLLVLVIISALFLPLHGQMLREGDLLFCCSEEPNAITDVTSGVGQLPIDHVGVVHRIGGDDGPIFVIEAIKPVVTITPIDTFQCRNSTADCQVIVGRVKEAFDVKQSIRRCLAMVGKPYDDLYLPGDSAVYCSELVQMCYIMTNGIPVFSTIPMSFHDSTGQVTTYWKDFYERHGMAVPEGAPGTNPGELSRREQVSIIGKYPRQL